VRLSIVNLLSPSPWTLMKVLRVFPECWIRWRWWRCVAVFDHWWDHDASVMISPRTKFNSVLFKFLVFLHFDHLRPVAGGELPLTELSQSFICFRVCLAAPIFGRCGLYILTLGMLKDMETSVIRFAYPSHIESWMLLPAHKLRCCYLRRNITPLGGK